MRKKLLIHNSFLNTERIQKRSCLHCFCLRRSGTEGPTEPLRARMPGPRLGTPAWDRLRELGFLPVSSGPSPAHQLCLSPTLGPGICALQLPPLPQVKAALRARMTVKKGEPWEELPSLPPRGSPVKGPLVWNSHGLLHKPVPGWAELAVRDLGPRSYRTREDSVLRHDSPTLPEQISASVPKLLIRQCQCSYPCARHAAGLPGSQGARGGPGDPSRLE